MGLTDFDANEFPFDPTRAENLQQGANFRLETRLGDLDTSRAGKLAPAALLEGRATALLVGDAFDASVGELTAALLLDGEPIEIERLAGKIHPVILAEHWRAGAARPNIHQTGAAIGQALARAKPLGIVSGPRWKDRRLTEVGRSALHTGLRATALGPARTI